MLNQISVRSLKKNRRTSHPDTKHITFASPMQRTVSYAFFLLFAWPAVAATEKTYAEAWAADHAGTLNVRTRDGTRCDIVTPKNAIEITFASQGQNAIGRALYQAAQMNKRAGIVLILDSKKDAIYRQRLDTTITVFNLPIEVWETGPGVGQ
jgi:hypothetical protein